MSERQYIGARYVPLFFNNPTDGSINWIANYQYDALTIVSYLNQSYTSKIPVPASVGNPADNPLYWALTGSYNAQVAQLSSDVDELREEVENNVKIFENLSALSNDTTLTGGELCYIKGYYDANDGGEGYYIVSDTEPDGYYVNIRNSLYAEAVFNNGSINVKRFGAKGDGLHDDTNAFQNALNFCATINEDNYSISLYRYGGGNIYIPSGRYLISNTLTMPEHTSIIGENASSVMIEKNNAGNFINIPDVTTIKNITFVGNGSGNIIDSVEVRTHDSLFENLNFRCSRCSSSIAINQGWNNIFRNIHIYGGACGIYVSKHNTDNPNNYTFENVQISNTNVRGIHMESAIIARFANCDIEATGQNSITQFDSNFMPVIKGVTKSFSYPVGLEIEDYGRGVSIDACWFERNMSSIESIKAIAIELSGNRDDNNACINNSNFWTDNTIFLNIHNSYSVEFNGGHYHYNSSYNELGNLPTTILPVVNGCVSLASALKDNNIKFVNSREWGSVVRKNLDVSTECSPSSGIVINTAQLVSVGKLNILTIDFNCTSAKSNGNTICNFSGIPNISDSQTRTVNTGVQASGSTPVALRPYGVSGYSLGVLCQGAVPVGDYYTVSVIYFND